MSSCCPVCYRATDERVRVRDTNEGEKLQKRFFELFERFLNPDKINNEQAGGRNQSWVNFLPSALAGTGLVSCGQCLELMESFCELFHQLKTIELLIAWKVETLKNVMVCAGKVPSRNADFRNFMNGLEVSERVDEVVKARRSLIKNCCQKLRNSFPKLSIEKWMADKETSPQWSPQSGQTMISKLVDNIDNEGQQMGTPMQVAKPNQCDSRAEETPHNGNIFPNLVSTPTILEDRLTSGTEVKQCSKTTDRKVDAQHSNQTIDPDHGHTEDTLEDMEDMDVDIESDNYVTAVTPPETEAQIEESMLECNDRAEKGHNGNGLLVSTLEDQVTSVSVAEVELVCPIHGGDNGDGDEDNNDQLSTHTSDHGHVQDKDDDIFTASENYAAPLSNTEALALVKGPLIEVKPTIKIESPVESIPDPDAEAPSPSTTPDSLLIPVESPPGLSVVDVVATTSNQVAHQSPKERTSRLRSTYRCQNCNKTFSSNERLKMHIQECHPEDDDGYNRLSDNDEIDNNDDESDSDDQDDNGGDATWSDIGKIDKDSMCLASSSFDEQEGNQDSTDQKHVTQLSYIAKTEKLYKWSIIHAQSVKQSHYRLKCPDCNGLFRSPQLILAHRRTSKSCSGTYDPSKSVKVQVLVPPKSRTKNQAANKRMFTTVHAIIDLPQAIFVCNLEHCGSVQYTAEDMETHKKLHGSFPCKFCKAKMSFAPRLSMHELQHFKKEKNEKGSKDLHSHSCPRCDFKGTRRPKYIQHHMTSHLSLTVNQPVCPICKTHSFALSTDLRDHASHFKNWHDVSNVTIPEDIIHCTVPDCDAYFLFPNQLTEHLAYRHNLRDRRNLKKQETLDKPLTYRSRRGEQPWKRGQPHKCKDCGKEYKGLRILWSHRLKVHVDPDKVVRCTIPKCERVFETAKQVEHHIKCARIYHKTLDCPDVQCPKCDKTFKGGQSSFLAAHLKTHERGERPFCCELCGKAFKWKDRLDNHLLAHSGPESWKFECSTCGLKARDKYRLAAHMKRHTNEKPYICQLCGLKYADRHNLRFHVNKKHGDVMEDKAKKYDQSNQASTKGIKRKRPKKVEPEVDADQRDSDSDTN